MTLIDILKDLSLSGGNPVQNIHLSFHICSGIYILQNAMARGGRCWKKNEAVRNKMKRRKKGKGKGGE